MAGYSLSKMLEVFRSQINDLALPYLWSDAEVFSYLTQAEMEYASITRKLVKLVELPVYAFDPHVKLPEYVEDIISGHLIEARRDLFLRNMADLPSLVSRGDYGVRIPGEWRTTQGTPSVLIGDEQKGSLRLVPMPVLNDTLQLQVVKVPDRVIASLADTLTFSDIRDQLVIMLRMRGLAYEKHDADAGDEGLAGKFNDQFLAAADQMAVKEQQKTTSPRSVKYRGL